MSGKIVVAEFEDAESGVYRPGELTISRQGDGVELQYDSDDSWYSFGLCMTLGRLLLDLGFTSEDCRRAIAEAEH